MITTDTDELTNTPTNLIKMEAAIREGITQTRVQLDEIRADRDRRNRREHARYVFDRTGQTIRTLQRTAALPELPADERRVFEDGIRELTALREEARQLI